MALKWADRTRETTATAGTGAVALLGAVQGYQAFAAALANGDTCYYTIADQAGPNWEVGLGTYASGPNTLTRTSVLASSNGGAAVAFGGNTKDVWLDLPADRVTKTPFTDLANTFTVAQAFSSIGFGASVGTKVLLYDAGGVASGQYGFRIEGGTLVIFYDASAACTFRSGGPAGTEVVSFVDAFGVRLTAGANQIYQSGYGGTILVNNVLSVLGSSSIANPATVGINTGAPAGTLHARLPDALTNAVGVVGVLEHASSGTPAAGFGGSLVWLLQSSTTAARTAGEVDVTWATATDATRKARWALSVWDTAAREVLRGEASGAAAMLGFFGAAAVVQQANASQAAITAVADANAKAALQALYNLLVNYGLAPATA